MLTDQRLEIESLTDQLKAAHELIALRDRELSALRASCLLVVAALKELEKMLQEARES